jgi:hypothetical protein
VLKKGSSRPCSSKVDGDGIGGPNSRAYVGSMGCNITGNLRSRLASFVTFVLQHHSFILEDFLYRLLFVRVGWRKGSPRRRRLDLRKKPRRQSSLSVLVLLLNC